MLIVQDPDTLYLHLPEQLLFTQISLQVYVKHVPLQPAEQLLQESYDDAIEYIDFLKREEYWRVYPPIF